MAHSGAAYSDGVEVVRCGVTGSDGALAVHGPSPIVPNVWRPRADTVAVDEVLHADQENVYNSRPFHRKVLGIVPGEMEMWIFIPCVTFFRFSLLASWP